MSTLITKVNGTKSGLESVGAFVKGVRQKMNDVAPHLDHATPEQVSTLWELCCAIEGTCALNQAQIRRRDAIAAKQNEQHEKLAGDGLDPVHKEH